MKLRCLLSLFLALGTLAGCSGGGSDRPQNSVDVRLFNAVVNAEPLDLLVDEDPKSTNVAFGSAGPYANFAFGSRQVKVRPTAGGDALASGEANFGPNGAYTMIAHGPRSAVILVPMNEDNTQVAANRIRLRLANLAPESPSLDLYVTPGTDISAATPSLGGIPYTAVGSYINFDPGSYAIVLTESGTKNVLFQAPPQEFTAGTKATIAALPSTGARLVAATVLPTLAESRPLASTLARIRSVNALPGSPPMNFRDTVLFSSVTYQGVSDYVTTSSGAHTLRLEQANVPGTTVATLNASLTPARDHTLVAVGNLASPRLVIVADDNSLPAAADAKMRFANLRADGVAVDVRLNGTAVVQGLAADGFSTPRTFPAATPQTIEFVAGGTVVATIPQATYELQGVYTVYLFGTGSALAPRVVRDR